MPRLRLPGFVKQLGARLAPHSGWLAGVLQALLLAALGWYGIQWREILWPKLWAENGGWAEASMDWFQRVSYDLPFVFRDSLPGPLRFVAGAPTPTKEAVILYMDEDSTRRLDQKPGAPWS